MQGLFMRVGRVPAEGESTAGCDFSEPEDGGKATNQAVAAARLGAPVFLVSVVGADERGGRALKYLVREGVDTTFVTVASGPTDVGFVMLPPSGVPAIASADDRSRDLDGALVAGAAASIASAAVVLAQLEAPVAAATEAFRIARAHGVPTILNPSPAIEVGPEFLRLADFLVPNEHEAAALAGRSASPHDLAAELGVRLRPTAVLVTAGADGVFVSSGNGVEHVPAPRVEAVDTTGAGDAFVGAFAVRLRAGDRVLSAAAFAVRAASISVTRVGTVPAFPRLSELREASALPVLGT